MPLTRLYQALVLLTSVRVVVTGWSMYPTLAPGEYALFDRLAYTKVRPRAGDVVLARGIPGTERSIIKRVAAAPGDTVRVNADGVWVNGVPLEQDVEADDPPVADAIEWAMGADEYFLLGDARDLSTDSRSFGPVTRSTIKARAWLVYWPWSRRRVVESGPPGTAR